jgi:hypothetical protein
VPNASANINSSEKATINAGIIKAIIENTGKSCLYVLTAGVIGAVSFSQISPIVISRLLKFLHRYSSNTFSLSVQE